jgi:hypothetical protein
MKVWPETRKATKAMDATMLVVEATRYLEIVDLFRSLGLAVKWRSEADEIGVPRRARKLQRRTMCERCAGPLVRINGRHICFQM